MTKKLTTEEFVERAVEVHGDKYDYSKVVYLNSKDKVEIICKGHKNFWQSPGNHISRQAGCPACANCERPTTQAFLAQCTEKHNGKYTYERAVYVSIYTKFTVTCPAHGDFQSIPNNHKRGAGCAKCGALQSRPLMPLVEFLTQCAERHGDKYVYDKLSYAGVNTKVTVTCKLHGDFQITPDKHKQGQGCPVCTGWNTTTESFITNCTKQHEGRYSYSKSIFVSAKEKLTITCPVHGDFKMTPSDHKAGSGCSACATNGYNTEKSGYLYVLSDNTVTKVGITNRSVEDRRKKIVKSSGLDFTEKFSFYFENGATARALEKETLSHLKIFHSQPMGVFDGSTEAFYGVDLEKLQTRIYQQISILEDTKTILMDKPEVLNIENTNPTNESEPNNV